MTNTETIKAIDAEIKRQEAELQKLREEKAAIVQEENHVDKLFDAVQRYKVGYSSDAWGDRSSTPTCIPAHDGAWVRFSDMQALQAGYDAARLQIESLQSRLGTCQKSGQDWAMRVHALEAKLFAIGAGGVEPLRKARAASAETKISALMSKISILVDKRLSCEPCAEAEEDLLLFLRTRYASTAYPTEGVPAQAAASTDQSRAQFDAWIRTHEEEHGAVDEASAWAAWSACSLMQVTNTTMHGLEQFIEQVGDVHFQRCRVGSKEGAIRWDIEFGDYGAKVRDKTLRDAITKALAAQAEQGGEE